jgi:hypothetical protein
VRAFIARAKLALKGYFAVGEIIIKIPQAMRREFKIDDEEFARHLVASLEAATDSETQQSAADAEEIVGIWKDREGITDPVEFARKLRREAWTRS